MWVGILGRKRLILDGLMSKKTKVQWTTFVIKLILCIAFLLMSFILLSLFVPQIFDFTYMVFDNMYPTGILVLQGISGLGLVYLFYCWRRSPIGLESTKVTDIRQSEQALLKIWMMPTPYPEIIHFFHEDQKKNEKYWELSRHGQLVDSGCAELPLVHQYHCAPEMSDKSDKFKEKTQFVNVDLDCYVDLDC